MTVLQTYYNPSMLEPGHALSPSGVYQSLDLPNHKAHLDYIAGLPIIASPDVFGLHDNADISKDLKETNLLLDSLLLTQSRDAAGWLLSRFVVDALGRIPQLHMRSLLFEFMSDTEGTLGYAHAADIGMLNCSMLQHTLKQCSSVTGQPGITLPSQLGLGVNGSMSH